jgi:hypothetical protein
MSYTKLLKRAEREYKRKKKEEQVKRDLQEEKEHNRKISIFLAEIRELKKMQVQEQLDKKTYIAESKNFLQDMAKNYNYRLYMVAWDMINNNIDYIQSNIKKGKITKEEVKEIYQLAKEKVTKLYFNIECLKYF